MKKYLLGSFAFIVAISLSAFTSIKKNKPSLDVLYWYEVTYDAGNTNPRILEQTPQHVVKGSVISDCDGDAIDCYRGFVDSLISFPSTNTGEDQILKD